MSRYETIPRPLTDAIAVTDQGVTLLDWICFKSKELPFWDDLTVVVINEDTSNPVSIMLVSSARPPSPDEGYNDQVPAGQQRSFRLDQMPRHHFIKLVAKTATGLTARVAFEVVLRQSV